MMESDSRCFEISSTDNVAPGLHKTKKDKLFDFSRYPRRRIALLFLYLGWDYNGLVTQSDNKNTVEEYILNALEKTKLIENRECAQWSRCGRTDKGVSGFRQVASVTVRSTDINGQEVYWNDDDFADKRIATTVELQYDHILNQVLPADIRILAWSPAKPDFNARYDCSSRSYIYLFPKGRLSIEKMQDAANLLLGLHDFRNFCAIDMNKSRLDASYVRQIYEVDISPVSSEVGWYQMFQLKIKGSGFLWHQIRCIVAVLYDVGLGLEDSSVVTDLLDITNCSARPQYAFAKELPLCFFDATYNVEFDWKSCIKEAVLQKVFQVLQSKWCELQTKASIVKSMMDEIALFDINSVTADGIDVHMKGNQSRTKHCALLKRPRCDSLEMKKEKFCKKNKMLNDSNC
uniref:tRNA pseudouridine synthase n=1 Tax=Panagrolaimus sp. JU765 TaxID=591449 RepID=A0AC34RCD9_9BILA